MIKLGGYTWREAKDGLASWEVRGLTGIEQLEVQQRTVKESGPEGLRLLAMGMTVPAPEAMNYMAGCCIRAWKGFGDEDGNALPFDPDLVRNVPPLYFDQMCEHIWEMTQLTPEQEKNLESLAMSRQTVSDISTAAIAPGKQPTDSKKRPVQKKPARKNPSSQSKSAAGSGGSRRASAG